MSKEKLMEKLGLAPADFQQTNHAEEIETALCELAEMLAELENAIVDLAELIGEE